MAKGRSSTARRGGARGGDPEATALPGDERDRIIDAALGLTARQGWRRLSLAAVAAEAGLPILAVYRVFGSRSALLSGFFRRIDQTVLAGSFEVEAGERPRDRLFDLLMRRFDALLPYREALRVLGRELPADPCTAVAVGNRLLRSLAWMLEAAGISTQGLGGIIAVKLTAAAYVTTLPIWLRDESSDLAPTMAALDRRLRGIERWLIRTGRPRPVAAES